MPKSILHVVEQVAIDAAAVAIGFELGGPLGAKIALGIATIANSFIFAPKSPKPPSTEASIKISRPVRVSGYAANRRVTIVIP